jgi:hypothetical protein
VTVIGRAKKTAYETIIKILEKAGAKEKAEQAISDQEEIVNKPAEKPGAKPPAKK